MGDVGGVGPAFVGAATVNAAVDEVFGATGKRLVDEALPLDFFVGNVHALRELNGIDTPDGSIGQPGGGIEKSGHVFEGALNEFDGGRGRGQFLRAGRGSRASNGENGAGWGGKFQESADGSTPLLAGGRCDEDWSRHGCCECRWGTGWM